MITTLIRMLFYGAVTALIVAYWGPHIVETVEEISQTQNVPFERVWKDLLGLVLVIFVGSQVKRSWDQRHHSSRPKVSKKRKRSIDDNIKVPK